MKDNYYKTIAEILADPVDLIDLEARISRMREKFGNGNLELKNGKLLLEVEDGQRVMICHSNEFYHNVAKIVR